MGNDSQKTLQTKYQAVGLFSFLLTLSLICCFLTSDVPNNDIATFVNGVVEKEMCWGTLSSDWIMSTLFPSSRCRLVQLEPLLNVGIEALF